MSTTAAHSAPRKRNAPLLLTALLAGLLVAPLIAAALRAGAYLGVHDIATDYVLGAAWAAVIAFSILLWPIPFADRCMLFGLWTIKAAVALGFMLLYETAYTSLDAYGYFQASVQPSFDWSLVAFGYGTHNLMGLAWLHGRILPASYHALKVSFALIGLIGAYLFYRAAIAAGAKVGLRLLALVVLTPSILFWSSIVGKDPIILLGVAVYSLGLVHWIRRGNLGWLLVAGLGVLTASWIRIWFGPILVLPVIGLGLLGHRSALQRTMLLALAIPAFVVGASAFKEKYLDETKVDVVQATIAYTQYLAEGGSAQVRATPFTGAGSLIRFLPLGIFTALLRPLPGEVNNPFGLLAGLENLGLLTLVALAIRRTRLAEFRDPVIAWATMVITTWSLVYGFVSSQNLGTGARYRLQILPVFLLLLLYLARADRTPLTAPAR